MYALLFSLPGTPVIYYGDEIGMGDNIWLEDRNGVRTPMQWSAVDNGGFSSAQAARLYSPVIDDEVFGYRAVNVAAQQSDPTSLYQAIRHMIGLHKQHASLGAGTFHVLDAHNPAVLAYTRHHGDETILVVNNLSASTQPVQLTITEASSPSPRDILSGTVFPPMTDIPYSLPLGTYQSIWLLL